MAAGHSVHTLHTWYVISSVVYVISNSLITLPAVLLVIRALKVIRPARTVSILFHYFLCHPSHYSLSQNLSFAANRFWGSFHLDFYSLNTFIIGHGLIGTGCHETGIEILLTTTFFTFPKRCPQIDYHLSSCRILNSIITESPLCFGDESKTCASERC